MYDNTSLINYPDKEGGKTAIKRKIEDPYKHVSVHILVPVWMKKEIEKSGENLSKIVREHLNEILPKAMDIKIKELEKNENELKNKLDGIHNSIIALESLKEKKYKK